MRGITTARESILEFFSLKRIARFSLRQFLQTTFPNDLTSTPISSTKMSTTKPTQTLAFFGATGGVCASTLALALTAGHTCTALSRTPSKLTTLLLTTYHLPPAVLKTHLTIHAGSISSPAAISLVLKNPTDPTKLVDTIIFGIGSSPVLQWNPLQPITLSDPHVCAAGTGAIFSALEALAAECVVACSAGEKPLFVSISTTGISDKARDVPALLWPVYKYALAVPHEDKRVAEGLLRRDQGGHVRDCVVVRPTLLTDGVARGVAELRVGWEWVGEERVRDGVVEVGPQLGWGVGRRDVGAFVFEKVVCEGGWEGRCVSLTY